MRQTIRAPRIPVQRLLAAGIVVAALMAVAPARADDGPDLLTEPFNVALGTFILNSDTKVRLNGEAQRGDKVDWEDSFGGGDLNRFRVDGYWRFADRHKVRALWFSSSRTQSKVLDKDISWGDEVFPVDAQATAAAPRRRACVTATVIPRSLKDPVGLCPSCFSSSDEIPAQRATDARESRGVLPSGWLTTASRSMLGSTSSR